MSDVFSHAVHSPYVYGAHSMFTTSRVEGWQQCWSVLILLRSGYDASVEIKKVPFLGDIPDCK